VGTKGLTFTLSVQVNSQVGVVNLNPSNDPVESFSIKETTSAGSACWYPPDPLSKFPMGFVFSNLIATPSIVQEGGPIVLSWTGTAGATYTIDWTDLTYSGGQQPPITNYKNTVFPPQGTGETLSAGPSPTAVVSVKAAYSTEGQTLHAGPLSVPVGVKLNAPTITSFTATWQGPVLELNWATENATSVRIPAITTDTQNPNSGEAPLLFTPSSAQPLPITITLMAINQSSHTASRTLEESYPQVAGSPISVNNPSSVAVSPNGKRVFITNIHDKSLTVLDAGTLKPISGSPFRVGKTPFSVAVSPDAVFVANLNDESLTVLDARTLQPITGSPVSVVISPLCVAVSPDGTWVFVSNGNAFILEGTLTVLDARTLQPVTGSPVSVGTQPTSVAVSPDGTRVFVANLGACTLTVLDGATLQPVTGSPFWLGSYPSSVAVSLDSPRVFVVSADNLGVGWLTVLDARTVQPVTGSPFPLGKNPGFVAVSADSARLFITNVDDKSLTVLDARTLQPISGSPFPVGEFPGSVAVSPDSTHVFVANTGDNTLTVLTPTYVPANG
jgi:YVTN family beta-propeller protein